MRDFESQANDLWLLHENPITNVLMCRTKRKDNYAFKSTTIGAKFVSCFSVCGASLPDHTKVLPLDPAEDSIPTTFFASNLCILAMPLQICIAYIDHENKRGMQLRTYH